MLFVNTENKRIKKGSLRISTFYSGPYHIECVLETGVIVINSEYLRGLKRDISQVEDTLDDIEANPLKKKTRKRKFREQTNDADITWSGYFKIKKLDKIELIVLYHYNDVNVFTIQQDRIVISGYELTIRQILWSLQHGVPK